MRSSQRSCRHRALEWYERKIQEAWVPDEHINHTPGLLLCERKINFNFVSNTTILGFHFHVAIPNIKYHYTSLNITSFYCHKKVNMCARGDAHNFLNVTDKQISLEKLTCLRSKSQWLNQDLNSHLSDSKEIPLHRTSSKYCAEQIQEHIGRNCQEKFRKLGFEEQDFGMMRLKQTGSGDFGGQLEKSMKIKQNNEYHKTETHSQIERSTDIVITSGGGGARWGQEIKKYKLPCIK